jgi:hypothetical protein
MVSVWHWFGLVSFRVTRSSRPASCVSVTVRVRWVRTRLVERDVASVICWRVSFSPSFIAALPPACAPRSNFATPTVKPTLPVVEVSKPAWCATSCATSPASRRVPELSFCCSSSNVIDEVRVEPDFAQVKISTVCSSCGPRENELTTRPCVYPSSCHCWRNGM